MNPAGQPSAGWLALPSEGRARTFQAKPLWQRAIVVEAGPITNFLIAILILAGLALAYGESRTPATVGPVLEGSAAARIGLATGDRILSLGGRLMDQFEALDRCVTDHPGDHRPVSFRGGGA